MPLSWLWCLSGSYKPRYFNVIVFRCQYYEATVDVWFNIRVKASGVSNSGIKITLNVAMSGMVLCCHTDFFTPHALGAAERNSERRPADHDACSRTPSTLCAMRRPTTKTWRFNFALLNSYSAKELTENNPNKNSHTFRPLSHQYFMFLFSPHPVNVQNPTI